MNLATSSTTALHGELNWLRGRYDCGAVAPAVYVTIKQLETALAWREHQAHRSAQKRGPTAQRIGERHG